MSDPAVCCFLTKTLCAHGGQLGLPELRQHIDLSEQQLEETLLTAGPRRFLLLPDGGGGRRVLAASSVRICVLKECGGCERLHLCKLHLMGKCNLGSRSCKYSHDIISAENKKVLKTHELSGLEEDELRVLLLQNDPFLLPDVCQFYNRKDRICNQQNNCNRLHICRHFLHGECKFLPCKRSHNLLSSHELRLLESAGIDWKIAANIQAIYDHRHVEFNKKLKGKIPNYKPQEKLWKHPPARSRKPRMPVEKVSSTLHVSPSEGPSSNVLVQNGHQLPAGAGGQDEGAGAGGEDEDAGGKDEGAGAGGEDEDAGSKDEGAGAGGKDEGAGAGGKDEGAGAGGKDEGAGAGGKDEGAIAGGKEEDVGAGAVGEKGVEAGDTGAEGKDKDETDASSAKASKASKEAECDEICVFYVWRYCKYKEKCRSVHYHLPYRWQMFDGVNWNDLSGMEEIEKAYCDPNINSIEKKSINFMTMTCRGCLLQRLSTPSWVTRPTFVLTTEWVWYWKNDLGQWIEYGGHGEGDSVKSPHSAVIENLYQADPDAMVSFQAGLQHYQLDFKAMVQTNTSSKTRRQVCRRPKFVSYEDVQKIKQGQRDSSIPNQVCPNHWDQTALPEFGYKAVEISNTSSEYIRIKQMFHQTMKSYTVLKIRRIQNPSLWKVFQWQKEQMKRENGGKEVNERLLFHGTQNFFLESICIHNFDWRICGSNGTNYGKGSYFARDASYCHGHCQPAVKKHSMFVARVLVGDYVTGYSSYVRPPPKSGAGLRFYDSCVDNELNPSVFVVFEKNQIYPEYIIEYKAEEKCILC